MDQHPNLFPPHSLDTRHLPSQWQQPAAVGDNAFDGSDRCDAPEGLQAFHATGTGHARKMSPVGSPLQHYAQEARKAQHLQLAAQVPQSSSAPASPALLQPSSRNNPFNALSSATGAGDLDKMEGGWYYPPSPLVQALLDRWFDMADASGQGRVGGQAAVEFFCKSGLPRIILRDIWNIAALGTVSFLERRQFYVAMRLISMAQAGHELSQDNLLLLASRPMSLPHITGDSPQGRNNLGMELRTGSPIVLPSETQGTELPHSRSFQAPPIAQQRYPDVIHHGRTGPVRRTLEHEDDFFGDFAGSQSTMPPIPADIFSSPSRVAEQQQQASTHKHTEQGVQNPPVTSLPLPPREDGTPEVPQSNRRTQGEDDPFLGFSPLANAPMPLLPPGPETEPIGNETDCHLATASGELRELPDVLIATMSDEGIIEDEDWSDFVGEQRDLPSGHRGIAGDGGAGSSLPRKDAVQPDVLSRGLASQYRPVGQQRDSAISDLLDLQVPSGRSLKAIESISSPDDDDDEWAEFEFAAPQPSVASMTSANLNDAWSLLSPQPTPLIGRRSLDDGDGLLAGSTEAGQLVDGASPSLPQGHSAQDPLLHITGACQRALLAPLVGAFKFEDALECQSFVTSIPNTLQGNGNDLGPALAHRIVERAGGYLAEDKAIIQALIQCEELAEQAAKLTSWVEAPLAPGMSPKEMYEELRTLVTGAGDKVETARRRDNIEAFRACYVTTSLTIIGEQDLESAANLYRAAQRSFRLLKIVRDGEECLSSWKSLMSSTERELDRALDLVKRVVEADLSSEQLKEVLSMPKIVRYFRALCGMYNVCTFASVSYKDAMLDSIHEDEAQGSNALQEQWEKMTSRLELVLGDYETYSKQHDLFHVKSMEEVKALCAIAPPDTKLCALSLVPLSLGDSSVYFCGMAYITPCVNLWLNAISSLPPPTSQLQGLQ